MPEEEALPLKPELLKLLASDSRREILRHLRSRRMTLSELARAVKLQKATVLEHLGKLTDAGLVQRHEDAERVWVYYSLTREGKRMMSPQRTRFYLVVGVAVMATLFGVVLAVTFSGLGPEPDATGDPAARDALRLEGVDTESAPGERAAFKVRVASGAAPARAFLLTPEDADALRSGSGPAYGTPLTVDAAPRSPATSGRGSGDAMDDGMTSGAAGDGASGDAPSEPVTTESTDLLTLHAPDGVDPGTYYVYAQSSSGADNRDALVPVQVRGVNVTGVPDAWVRGVDDDLTLTVTRDDAPVDGMLILRGPGEMGRGVENGTVTLDARDLDALPPGAYRVLHAAHADAPRAGTGRTLLVADPDVAVTPQQVVAGAPVTLNVSVRAVDRPRDDVPVRVDGAPLDGAWTPEAPGVAQVQVGRLVTHTVRVVPDVRVAFTASADGLAVAVTNATGAPARNVALHLADTAVTLDENASAVLTAPPQGTVDVTLTSANASVTRAVVVDGWNVTVPRVPVTLEAAGGDGVRAITGSPTNGDVNASALRVTLHVTGRVAGGAFTSSLVDVRVPDALHLTRTVNASSAVSGTDATFSARDVTWPPVAFTNASRPANDSADGADAPALEEVVVDSEVVRLRGVGSPPAGDVRFGRVPVHAVGEPSAGDAVADSPAGGSAGVPAPGAPVVLALALAAAVLVARRRARP